MEWPLHLVASPYEAAPSVPCACEGCTDHRHKVLRGNQTGNHETGNHVGGGWGIGQGERVVTATVLGSWVTRGLRTRSSTETQPLAGIIFRGGEGNDRPRTTLPMQAAAARWAPPGHCHPPRYSRGCSATNPRFPGHPSRAVGGRLGAIRSVLTQKII